MESYRMWPFVSGFHLPPHFWDSSLQIFVWVLHAFLWLNTPPVWIYHSVFIHSPAEGYLLRCLQVLAVMSEFSFCKHLFDFPGGSNSRESTCNAGDLGLIPALGRSPGGGNGNPLQYSCLGNPMDKEAELARGYSPNGCKECDCWIM